MTPIQLTSAACANIDDTLEAWALAYVRSTSLSHKRQPPAPPRHCYSERALREGSAGPCANPQGWDVPAGPGRPPELRVVGRAKRNKALTASKESRARWLHTFWHHELQAAELMCWALLRFDSSEPEFRHGLARICQDEIRHMALYEQRLGELGYALGDFPVRDWFWERIPTCSTALSFVAVMGLGLESANLEHGERFAQQFNAVGDEESAAIQTVIAREEEAHAAFAAHWFVRWTGALDFERWKKQLPPPLSPLLMHGSPLAWAARRRAGQPETFLEALAQWTPEDSGT